MGESPVDRNWRKARIPIPCKVSFIVPRAVMGSRIHAAERDSIFQRGLEWIFSSLTGR
jgi:hypothetical protein